MADCHNYYYGICRLEHPVVPDLERSSREIGKGLQAMIHYIHLRGNTEPEKSLIFLNLVASRSAGSPWDPVAFVNLTHSTFPHVRSIWN